jgi:hypothetical protein
MHSIGSAEFKDGALRVVKAARVGRQFVRVLTLKPSGIGRDGRWPVSLFTSIFQELALTSFPSASFGCAITRQQPQCPTGPGRSDPGSEHTFCIFSFQDL